MANRANAAKAARRLERALRLANHSNGEEFRQDTLSHTREILHDTLTRLAKATEPKDRELLARSASHLAEIERRLAGRPLPSLARSRAEPTPPSTGLPQPR